MQILEVSDERVQYLCAGDETLKKLIFTIGSIPWPLKDDYFVSLVHSIVSQQLSNKAAASIYHKLEALCGRVQPETIASFSEAALKSTGLSQSKTRYISELANSFLSSQIQFENIDSLDDSAVIQQLTQLHGIGQWTAEMFLIFSLHRQNVLSFGDAGIQSTIKWLYGESRKDVKEYMTKLQQRWSPYNSIAALYLWEAVDQGYTKSNPSFS